MIHRKIYCINANHNLIGIQKGFEQFRIQQINFVGTIQHGEEAEIETIIKRRQGERERVRGRARERGGADKIELGRGINPKQSTFSNERHDE